MQSAKKLRFTEVMRLGCALLTTMGKKLLEESIFQDIHPYTSVHFETIQRSLIHSDLTYVAAQNYFPD